MTRNSIATIACVALICMAAASVSNCAAPTAAKPQVIFEDTFNGNPSAKWQFSGDPWEVVDSRFMPLALVEGQKSSAWVDVGAHKALIVEVDFTDVRDDVTFVKLGGDAKGTAIAFVVRPVFYFGRPLGGWEVTRPGKTDATALPTKEFKCDGGDVRLRLELTGERVLATVNGVTWDGPLAGTNGRVEIGMVAHYKDIQKRTRVKRVVISGAPSGGGGVGAGVGGGGGLEPAPCVAPFAVDPRDLDTLAENLAKNVERKPELKQRLARGTVALATFKLIDVPCQSVADNVSEDLTTGLIENGFRLVERGQLDKIFKELKIQDSGAIDPETAKKLGKLTGCDLIVVGSISDRGDMVAINARILETETGGAVTAVRQQMRRIRMEQ